MNFMSSTFFVFICYYYFFFRLSVLSAGSGKSSLLQQFTDKVFDGEIDFYFFNFVFEEVFFRSLVKIVLTWNLFSLAQRNTM